VCGNALTGCTVAALYGGGGACRPMEGDGGDGATTLAF
jgi:hypothetical protein